MFLSKIKIVSKKGHYLRIRTLLQKYPLFTYGIIIIIDVFPFNLVPFAAFS